MRVALLTPRFPYPPDRGDRLFAAHLLRTWSARHEVTLFSFVDGTETPEHRRAIDRMGVRVHTVHLPRWRSWLQAWLALPGRTPSQVAYYASGRMMRLVREVLTREPHDVVCAQLFRMAPFVAGLDHPARVLMLNDSIAMNLDRSIGQQPAWRRPGVRWEARRVARFEVEMARRFREAWMLSEPDAAALRARGCGNIVVVPHGIDEQLYGFTRRPSPERNAVFLGNLSVPHNIDAAEYAAHAVWPEVRRASPGAVLRIVGAAPAPRVLRLAGAPGVRVEGRVEDAREIWEPAHVLLAPLRFSSGIQNKVLEAMAAGVPVVTTPAVAEGISARAGEHLLVAGEPAGLAAAVCSVFDDPAAAERRAIAAREHVRRRFRWDAPLERIEWIASQHPVSRGRG